MSDQHTSNSRRFHRYCIECAWGHSVHAWNMATFCVQCGARLPKNLAVDEEKPRQHVNKNGRKCSVRRTDDVEVIPPSRSHTSGTRVRKNDLHSRKVRIGQSDLCYHNLANETDWVTKAQSFVAQNPYASATIGAASGGLAMTAGGALAAAGLSITAMGGGIVCGSAVVGLLACFGSMVGPNRNPETAYAGACFALVGGLLGATISVTGALVSALGVALGFAGTVVVSVSALAAAARSAQLCWEHREDIKRLLSKIREKLPGARTIEIKLPKQQVELHSGIN